MAERKPTEFEKWMLSGRTPEQDAVLLEAAKATPAPIAEAVPVEPLQEQREKVFAYLDTKFGGMVHFGDPFKGEIKGEVYVGNRTAEQVATELPIPKKLKGLEQAKWRTLIAEWITKQAGGKAAEPVRKENEEKVFAPERMQGPLGPDELAEIARTSEVRRLAAKFDASRRRAASAAETPVPAAPGPLLPPELEEPELEPTPAAPVVPEALRRPVPPRPRVETPVPPLRRPAAPRVDRIPTPAPIPEPRPAARPETPAPEPARGAARIEAEKAADARVEAVSAWRKIQELLEAQRDTKEQISKLRTFGYVREENRDEYDSLQNELEVTETHLFEAKEKWRVGVEEAAVLLEKRPSVLRKEIEKEVAAVEAAGGAGGGGVEGGRDTAPRVPEESKKWIWGKQIAKGLGGAAMSILGVKFFVDGVAYLREQRAHRKAAADIDAVIQDIESAITPAMRTEAREGRAVTIADNKAQALKDKIQKLVDEGKITKERKDQLFAEITRTIEKRAKEDDAARQSLSHETGKIFNDYLEKKVSKSQVAREFLNTAFVLSGMQLVRGVGMLAMGAVERTAAKLRQRNLELRGKFLESGGQEKTADLWDTFWEDTVENGVKEYLRSITAQGATEERKDVFKRAMDFGKALGTTARFIGIGSAMYAEYEEGKVSGMLDDFLNEYNRKGPAVFADNLTRNVYQVFHLHPTGERGKETLETPPEVKPVEVPIVPEAPTVDLAQRIQSENGVIRAMVADHKAEFVNGELVINLGDRSGGFSEMQQALRRLIDQEINLPTDHLRDVDADRAEKMVKMMTHLLRGETLPGHLFDKGVAIPTQADLDGIIGLNAQGDLVVHDYAKFEGALMGKLEGAVDGYNVSMMAYVNNTGHRAHQSIMDARASVEGKALVADDFDASRLVKAEEQRIGNLEAHAFGGKDITNVQVFDEDSVSFTKHADEYDFEVHVSDGELDYIMASKDGALVEKIHPTISTGFEDPLGHAKLSELLKDEIAERATEPAASGAAAAVERAPISGGGAVAASVDRTPHFANDLVKTVEEGGLKGADGKLHFGSFALEERWFQSWDDQDVGRFMDDSPARFSPARLFSSENDAHYKLAHAMELHKADPKMTVGQWAVENYKKIEEWTR